jgi:hypothetical protein
MRFAIKRQLQTLFFLSFSKTTNDSPRDKLLKKLLLPAFFFLAGGIGILLESSFI